MIVSINVTPETGLAIFGHRLGIEFDKIGVMRSVLKPDILVGFGSLPNVIPDGVKVVTVFNKVTYDKTKITPETIARERDEIARSDAVVFTTEFSQSMAQHILGGDVLNDKRVYIIPTGVDNNELIFAHNTLTRDVGVQYKRVKEIRRSITFVSASDWTKSRRGSDMVEWFKSIPVPNAWLIIVGADNNTISKKEHIITVRRCGFNVAAAFIRLADFYVHTGFMDSCPNGVVEALVSGLPVVYTGSGGVGEIVGASGFNMNVDPEDVMEPIDMSDPPKIVGHPSWDDVKKAFDSGDAIDSFPREDLHISNIANRYVGIFGDIL